MAKPTDPESPKTELIGGAEIGPSRSVDTDSFMTTVRSKPAGLLVVVDGPGSGQSLTFYEGSNTIGRDPASNVIALNFGDGTIHRNAHAYLTSNKGVCTVIAGDHQNPVQVNGRSLDGPAPIGSGDLIQLGRTTLRVQKS